MANPNVSNQNNKNSQENPKRLLNSRERLLNALRQKPVDRTPVWLMRQAGRYLPEYRKVRNHAKDFLTLCKTPELACEVTLQPIQRFPLDAAIIFSDILTIPDAYGLGLYFAEGEGPRFQKPIQTEADIKALPTLDPQQDLSYVMQAIRYTVQELQSKKIPAIGFAGSPWTIATYMVEGQSSKHFSRIKRMMFQSPKLLHALLRHLSNSIVDYLEAQIDAGVEVIMLFDTWGGVLSHPHYLEFSLQYMKEILQKIKQRHHPKNPEKQIPSILFTKNSLPYLTEILNSGSDAIGLDWTIDLNLARRMAEGKVALQGNIDPAVLYADAATIQKAVANCLAQYGAGSGHIFNLGHGMNPDVDPEKVSILLESCTNLSPQYHSLSKDVLSKDDKR